MTGLGFVNILLEILRNKFQRMNLDKVSIHFKRCVGSTSIIIKRSVFNATDKLM